MGCCLRFRLRGLYFFSLSLSLQYLLHYLSSVKSLVNRHAWSRAPVAETSWALLRDCYHGVMCIRHTPQHIAIATLYLAVNSYGVELPVGEKEWWKVCAHGKQLHTEEGLSKNMYVSEQQKEVFKVCGFVNLSRKDDNISSW